MANVSAAGSLDRQRKIRDGLSGNGWKGVVIGFDWPSEGRVISYLEDRNEVQKVATELVSLLVEPFIALREKDCEVNVSILGHSMGGYLIREALVQTDDQKISREYNWMVGQLILVAADISSNSLGPDSKDSNVLNRRCARLTNYYSGFDAALKVSNAKRLGGAPRVGRVGLPTNSIDKFVDVDCSQHFQSLNPKKWKKKDGEFTHSWYFQDPSFLKDLSLTVQGDIDRNYIPTRKRKDADNDLELL